MLTAVLWAFLILAIIGVIVNVITFVSGRKNR